MISSKKSKPIEPVLSPPEPALSPFTGKDLLLFFYTGDGTEISRWQIPLDSPYALMPLDLVSCCGDVGTGFGLGVRFAWEIKDRETDC